MTETAQIKKLVTRLAALEKWVGGKESRKEDVSVALKPRGWKMLQDCVTIAGELQNVEGIAVKTRKPKGKPTT